MRLTKRLGGNIELAIKQLAESKRSQVIGSGIIWKPKNNHELWEWKNG